MDSFVPIEGRTVTAVIDTRNGEPQPILFAVLRALKAVRELPRNTAGPAPSGSAMGALGGPSAGLGLSPLNAGLGRGAPLGGPSVGLALGAGGSSISNTGSSNSGGFLPPSAASPAQLRQPHSASASPVPRPSSGSDLGSLPSGVPTLPTMGMTSPVLAVPPAGQREGSSGAATPFVGGGGGFGAAAPVAPGGTGHGHFSASPVSTGPPPGVHRPSPLLAAAPGASPPAPALSANGNSATPPARPPTQPVPSAAASGSGLAPAAALSAAPPPPPDWGRLLDPSRADHSAALITRQLALGHVSVAQVAAAVTAPGMLAVVARLDEASRAPVRDAVLSAVLRALTASGPTVASSGSEGPTAPTTPAKPASVVGPHAPAAMLAALVALDMVVLRGVCQTLETLLHGDAPSRRSGLAVVAQMAALTAGAGVLATVTPAVTAPTPEAIRAALAPLAPLVASVAAEPAFECDAVTSARALGWRPAPQTSLVRLRSLAGTPHRRPIVAAAYVPSRDVLATCSTDGIVAIWSANGNANGYSFANSALLNNSSGNFSNTSFGETPPPSPPSTERAGRSPCGPSPATDAVSCVPLQLPMEYIPCAMDASTRGNAIAVVGAPAPRVRRPPSLFIYALDEAGVLSLALSVPRPAAAVVTAVKGVPGRQAVFCAAETTCGGGEPTAGCSNALNSGGSSGSHNLAFFSGHGAVTRELAGVHSDYITCLATSPDSDTTLLTGSRDARAKLWDTRASSSQCAELAAHTDTVTSIAVMRDVIATGSVDRRLLLWDVRKLSSPLGEKEFCAPVLRVCLGAQATAVVATVNVLAALALHPVLETLDMVPNVCYHAACPNQDGSLVFAAGERGTVDVYALRIAPPAAMGSRASSER